MDSWGVRQARWQRPTRVGEVLAMPPDAEQLVPLGSQSAGRCKADDGADQQRSRLRESAYA